MTEIFLSNKNCRQSFMEQRKKKRKKKKEAN